MERNHGIGGQFAVRSVDIPARIADSLASDLGAAGAPAAPAAPAGRVTLVGATDRPARLDVTGDAGDGRTVGRTADGILVEDRHGWWEAAGSASDLVVRVGGRVTPWALLGGVVRPAIQVSGLEAGVVVLHAAAVAIDGRAWLVAGWSESGKTEIALALAETGAAFVGDKWTVVAPAPVAGTDTAPAAADDPVVGRPVVSPFPVRVGIRDWVVRSLPILRGGLGGGRRARLRGGRLAESVGQGAARLAAGGKATDALLGPVGQVGSLAATIRLSADEIRRIYAQPAPGPDPLPLDGIIVLATTEAGAAPSATTLDRAVAADRLARSAAYERRGYHLLGERARALGPAPIPGFTVIDHEREAIAPFLAGVPVFELRTPFPADPRIPARLIRDLV